MNAHCVQIISNKIKARKAVCCPGENDTYTAFFLTVVASAIAMLSCALLFLIYFATESGERLISLATAAYVPSLSYKRIIFSISSGVILLAPIRSPYFDSFLGVRFTTTSL